MYSSPPVWNATFLRRSGRTNGMVDRDVSRSLKWKKKIFIWIRRNPLKSPVSTKGIQGNASDFPWIYLDLLAFPCTNSAGARPVSLCGSAGLG
jgi:hypothetical protein